MIIQHYASHMSKKIRIFFWGLTFLTLAQLFVFLSHTLLEKELSDKAVQHGLWFANLVGLLAFTLIMRRLFAAYRQDELYTPLHRRLWMQLASYCWLAAFLPALLVCSLKLAWGLDIRLLTLLAHLNLPLLGVGTALPFAAMLLKVGQQLEDEQNLTI